MARLLLTAVVIALLLWAVRRALGAGPVRGRSRRGVPGGKLGPPEQLVCGACGAEFEADKNGWICPKCGK
jgi:hypothetical protein